MKQLLTRITVSLLSFCMVAIAPVQYLGLSAAARPPVDQKFSDDELDELLSPIALYPDPLLAQILPAATFLDQIDEAQRTLNGKSDDNLIAKQKWDVSVMAVAHYPQVLQMMDQKEDWTTALGQAYVNQPGDVEKSIQRLRAEAQGAGSLASNDKVTVAETSSNGQPAITIVPAQPQVIYVPQYDPQVVYVQQSGPSTGAVIASSLISFGTGLAIGAWLNRDWRWYGGGPYYHGWNGGGWVGVNRSQVNVNVNRNVYINNNFQNVNVNRNINNRNINNYRTNLNRDSVDFHNNVNRNNVNRDVNRTNANVNRGNPNAFKDDRVDALRQNDSRVDAARGRDSKGTAGNSGQQLNRTPQQQGQSGATKSAFGGYGNRDQVKAQADRGNKSLENMQNRGSSGGGGGGGGAGRAGGGRAGRKP